MGHKFIVKTWKWIDGQVTLVQTPFDQEAEALNYARLVNPAETVKVYVEDEILYTSQPDQSTFA
jgi:hypothetical protein